MSSSSPPLTPEDQAFTLIASRKFHQIFTVPPTGEFEELKVTYSVAGPDIGEGEDGGKDVPTVLWCGAMFGTRWQAVSVDFLARREGVRVLFVDRPGFGGSTPVPLPQRLATFIHTTTSLLTHLSIPSIHIASHSAGTLYALSLLLLHPSLLPLKNPTLHLLAPWVHQSSSGVSFLKAASFLPNGMLDYWDSLLGGIVGVIGKSGPAIGVSSGVFHSVQKVFGGGEKRSKEELEREKGEEEKRCQDICGMSLEGKEKLDKLATKCQFAEGMKGANDDARLCLKSVDGVGWGVVDDYPSYVGKLGGMWKERVRGGGDRLKVRVVYGEEDVMVGEKGMRYFEEVWGGGKTGEAVEVEVRRVEGGDHDNLIDPMRGVMGSIFKLVKGDI